MQPTPSISIFNHVLGPVMRGPSSSHTAGAYHIACMARDLLGAAPCRATFAFDPAGSYAATYVQQGADRGFAMGLMGKPLTDESFFSALADAAAAGLDIRFEVRTLARADHPNSMELALAAADGGHVRVEARSVGGGAVELTRVDDWPVLLSGAAYELLVETAASSAAKVAAILGGDGALMGAPDTLARGNDCAVVARRAAKLGSSARAALAHLSGGGRVRESSPVYLVQTGAPLFESAARMAALAEERAAPLGELALDYEAALLGMRREDVRAEMLRRFDIMAGAAARGLDLNLTGLQLLSPSAGAIFAAEAAGRLSTRSLHTRAAARAMAVMHVDGAMGVVCAAPTGGSAGVLPGVVVTLAEERGLSRERIAQALLAAGAIGVIVARRATFAAEVAGCQVEIGAAGAMAAAAVVDGIGGSARQACDAAAIAFQNTMGSVCDLVHGMVEIPCHTRNAAAAASAFVCADLVLGGYANPIPLDETIDAVMAVGCMLPPELRCTSRGGLAVTPSALALGTCGGPAASPS